MDAIRIYRKEFQPSDQLKHPYVIAGINVIAADTNEQAEYLSTSAKQMFVGVITGERKPLQPPVDDINEVRDRVGLDPLVTVTLDDILQERKLELMFEGQLLHDLKRTQRNVGTRTYDDPKLVLPIPRREIDSNPNLCQNASYQGPSC